MAPNPTDDPREDDDVAPDFDFDLADIPALVDVYDESTLARIDDAASLPAHPGATASGARVVRARPALRSRLAGVALTGAIVSGVADILEPEAEPAFEEVDPGISGGPDEFVTMFFVPNDPHATVAIVRPWLAPSLVHFS